jgi:hypothetical protein
LPTRKIISESHFFMFVFYPIAGDSTLDEKQVFSAKKMLSLKLADKFGRLYYKRRWTQERHPIEQDLAQRPDVVGQASHRTCTCANVASNADSISIVMPSATQPVGGIAIAIDLSQLARQPSHEIGGVQRGKPGTIDELRGRRYNSTQAGDLGRKRPFKVADSLKRHENPCFV